MNMRSTFKCLLLTSSQTSSPSLAWPTIWSAPKRASWSASESFSWSKKTGPSGASN
uniref:Uncharacterized protein n=1 Tax=Anguilla anguilla TaxID=7936 RepID=A0A0E9XQ36_ANGAN